MSAFAARRVFGQYSRLGARRQASVGSRVVARRGMASDAHKTTSSSSDLPWIIGAGAALAIGSAYILSPPAKKHAHAAAVAAAAPVEKALPPPEKVELESVPEPVIVKDDEGVEADVSQSEKQSFEADSPKDAKAAEEVVSKVEPEETKPDAPTPYDEGAPGQTEEVHTEDKPEQKEKPTKRHGTLQGEGETGPTDLSVAREAAKSGSSPKEASGQA